MKYIIYIIITIISINNTYALEYSIDNIEEYTQRITGEHTDHANIKKQEDYQLKYKLTTLCNNLLYIDGWLATFHTNNTYITYDARSSLFVTIICTSILNRDSNNNKNDDRFPLHNILKQHNIRSLWLACLPKKENTVSLSKEDCALWWNNETDIPYIYYNLINIIISNITDLGIGWAYWSRQPDTDTTTLANRFMVNHFNTLWYTSSQKAYQKTTKKLEEYIEIWKNIQKNSNLIITQNIKKIDKDTTLRRQDLLNYNNEGLSPTSINELPTYPWAFIDILYNELFFYTLFSNIYTNSLEDIWQRANQIPYALQVFIEKWLPITSIIQIQKDRTQRQEHNVQVALEHTIRQINNFISLYPIHIGLLMYQEDVITLRNNFANIYLPLHQLHYKLENVQAAKK